MKTKMFLTAALIGAAALSACSANAGFFLGIALPAPVVVPIPVAPLVVSAPVVTVPSVVVAIPPCPAPGYVWAPGYWSVTGCSRVWVSGCWQRHSGHVVCGHPYAWHR